LILGLESSVRLVNILMVSLLLVRTTSSADWMEGLEKLLGPMTHRLPGIRDLLAVGALSVKFLPMIIAETEEHFAGLRKKETVHSEWGYQKIRSVIHSVLQFIVSIFSDLDRYRSTRRGAD
jgi:energy-coupling factor transporter transmembrane protein EcfT